MSAIAVERNASAAIVYHVLSHLDLGRDAASLYDRRRPSRDWTEPLARAYAAASGRLVVHAIGLWFRDVDALLDALRREAPGLRDPAGRALASALADAIASERAAYEEEHRVDTEAFFARRERFVADAVPVLAKLRAALVEKQDSPPPPLQILDCPTLGPNGRATSKDGTRIVAVSLQRPIEDALIQVLHEEIHPVTDPLVDEGRAHERDTRADAAGHELHLRLERVAVEVGDALVATRAPQLHHAYARWRARVGL